MSSRSISTIAVFIGAAVFCAAVGGCSAQVTQDLASGDVRSAAVQVYTEAKVDIQADMAKLPPDVQGKLRALGTQADALVGSNLPIDQQYKVAKSLYLQGHELLAPYTTQLSPRSVLALAAMDDAAKQLDNLWAQYLSNADTMRKVEAARQVAQVVWTVVQLIPK